MRPKSLIGWWTMTGGGGLDPQRKAMLDAIGFNWESKQARDHTVWLDRYRIKNFTCSSKENKVLTAWLDNQRLRFLRITAREDKGVLLEALDATSLTKRPHS